MFFVIVLAFRPCLWRLVRKTVLRLEVSHTIGRNLEDWKILPGSCKAKVRFSFRGKLHYLGKTH